MASATVNEPGAARRRLPTQARSRERVERILDAASHIVLSEGLDALTTRSIATAAEVPVASLYQYFADKEAVLLAICERDMAEMDAQVAGDLAALEELSVPALVETTMRAYVTVYHRRPAFMQIWVRGRTNPAIHEMGRQHNRQTARTLLELGLEAGLIEARDHSESELTAIAELAVETGDRAFQLAFETDVHGDPFLLDQAVELVSGYLLGFASASGRSGVRR